LFIRFFLQDLCNAPIPLDDTLDSFDEAQENQAVNFLLESFESSNETDEHGATTRLFSNLTATMLGAVGVQQTATEQTKAKIPPPRPLAPPKVYQQQQHKSVAEELLVLKEPASKGDRTDVAINVEDEVC